MNLSPRAANQLRYFDPEDVVAILDHLRDHPTHRGVQMIDISVLTPHPGPKNGTLHADTPPFRAFVKRHRDGSSVLISVVESRPRAP